MNRIGTILGIILLLGTSSLIAQQSALFEMPFYFVDSLGNRDTIILGYDPEAAPDQLNTIFGEEQISSNTPWDSLLEVRVSQFFYIEQIFSKKIILPAVEETPDCYRTTNFVTLIAYAKYPPVTMYYDVDQLIDARCEPHYSWFFFTGLWELLGFEVPAIPDSLYYCLASNDSVSFTPRHIDVETCNLGQDCIIIETGDTVLNEMFFVQFSNWGFSLEDAPYCEEVEVGLSASPSLLETYIAPNPFRDKLQITIKEETFFNIKIYDTLGKLCLVKQDLVNTEVVDLADLKKGIYFVQVQSGDRLQVHKVVKE